VCVCVCLLACLLACLFVCLFVWLLVCLRVCLFVCLINKHENMALFVVLGTFMSRIQIIATLNITSPNETLILIRGAAAPCHVEVAEIAH
jgi:hypothetical protein